MNAFAAFANLHLLEWKKLAIMYFRFSREIEVKNNQTKHNRLKFTNFLCIFCFKFSRETAFTLHILVFK